MFLTDGEKSILYIFFFLMPIRQRWDLIPINLIDSHDQKMNFVSFEVLEKKINWVNIVSST